MKLIDQVAQIELQQKQRVREMTVSILLMWAYAFWFVSPICFAIGGKSLTPLILWFIPIIGIFTAPLVFPKPIHFYPLPRIIVRGIGFLVYYLQYSIIKSIAPGWYLIALISNLAAFWFTQRLMPAWNKSEQNLLERRFNENGQ